MTGFEETVQATETMQAINSCINHLLPNNREIYLALLQAQKIHQVCQIHIREDIVQNTFIDGILSYSRWGSFNWRFVDPIGYVKTPDSIHVPDFDPNKYNPFISPFIVYSEIVKEIRNNIKIPGDWFGYPKPVNKSRLTRTKKSMLTRTKKPKINYKTPTIWDRL